VSFEVHELLDRLAGQMRREIAPAVDDEYQRTQTHVAGVILERLAREAALGERHRAAETTDIAPLISVLDELIGGEQTSSPAVPDDVRASLAHLRGDLSVMSLSSLVEALYRWGPDGPVAVAALDAIRRVLRRDIDRRMEIAG